jgi:nitrogen regulatory protein P-II 1
MKKIEAMVQPHRVRAIPEALLASDVRKIALLDAKAFGTRKGHEQVYRGVRFQEDYLRKVKMEVVVPDHLAEVAIASIIKADYTVRLADGDVLISNVDAVAHVRAEEIQEHAV